MLRRLMLPATALLLPATETVYPGCASFTANRGWDWTNDRMRIYRFGGGKRG